MGLKNIIFKTYINDDDINIYIEDDVKEINFIQCSNLNVLLLYAIYYSYTIICYIGNTIHFPKTGK